MEYTTFCISVPDKPEKKPAFLHALDEAIANAPTYAIKMELIRAMQKSNALLEEAHERLVGGNDAITR